MLRWIGFLATCATLGVLLFNIIREPSRQEAALADYRSEAIVSAHELYIVHCLECHGSAGQGLQDYPDLSAPYIRQKDTTMLFNTIERGRYGTEMAAFSLTEGGVLTRAEIETLVILIQYGDWDDVAQEVVARDLLPEEERSLLAEIAPTETPVAPETSTATSTPTSISLTKVASLTPTLMASPSTSLMVSPTQTASPTQMNTAVAAAVDLPQIEIVPTDILQVAELPLIEIIPTQPLQSMGVLPVIDIVPTQGSPSQTIGQAELPSIEIVPTQSVNSTSLPIIPVMPTSTVTAGLDEVLFSTGAGLYEMYCAECHGRNGNGRGEVDGVRTALVRRKSAEQLLALMFGNDDSREHAATFLPEEQTAIVYFIQHWDATR